MTLLVSNSSPFSLKSPFLPRKYPRSRLRIRRRRPPELRTRSSLDDALKTLISSLPSPNSLNLVPQSLALASGAAALYLSRFRTSEPDPDVADWILFTSPTPFNRSVLLRCPSVSFEDGGDESDRLLREDRHYVNLSRGKVPAKNERAQESEVGYQRVCVGTEDGGVVSLDWPENLDLGRDYGLDTMVLIVPGTAEGSMDRDVRLFVVDALNKGCFPIVMNPRGCAGSPLTTARLFTAADSDDICTAIRYINRLRPWTTLMGVGCGYGANMLTKYLAEVGERSPLTAAVCIDNPFDLEEATRSIPHHISMDQKLTGGLTEILRANKELFQGKSKGFNVAKALSATSVRDFDGAISMVSYGFDTIEDFYAVISTRQLVHKVKIPVLFIQSDGGTVPLFSVPRSSISENPFTSLLLCSCLPSAIRKPDRSAILWCQQLAIEWLAAVELAFLKGRHPLIKDVDITINPSKGLASLNRKASEKTISAGNRTHGSYDSSQWFLSRKNTNASALTKQSASNAVNGFLTNPLGNASKESDGAVDGKVDSQSDSVSDLHGMQKDTGSTDEGEETTESEESQVLQTASVVMNMLDVSMPGTLDDEEKKKVLAAMEQGETLMKALQGAVPEDVRGKLTTAVTDILQTQGTKLNLSGLRRIGWVHNVIPEGKPMVQEKSKGNSTTESGHDESHSLNQRKNVVGSDGRIEDGPSNVNAENNNTHESIQSSQEKAPQASVEAGSEMESKPSRPQNSEKASGLAGESIGEQHKVSEIDGKSEKQSADVQAALDDGNGAHSNETEREEALAEPNKPTATNSAETLSTGSSASEHQVVEQGNDIQKNEERITEEVVDQNVQSPSTKPEEQLPPHSSKSPSIPVTEVLEVVDQNVQSLSTKPEEQLPQHSSNSPSISVTQALNALTGFDDSTQVAVNSVFGVLEEMIDHFEKTSNEESFGGTDQTENEEIVNASKKVDDSINKSDVESDVAQRSENPEDSINNKDTDSYEGKNNLSKVNYGLTSSKSNSFYQVKDNDMALKNPDNEDLNKIEHIQNFPLDLAGKQYWESPYAAYLHRYFSTPLPAMESLDSDSTMDLYLDPEGGHWKMIDHEGNYYSIGESGENQSVDGRVSISSLGQSDMENIIEPSYVILDNEYPRIQHQSAKEHGVVDHKPDDAKAEELMCLVKNALLDALKIELGRRLGVPDLRELESSLVDDLEQVADAVSQAVIHDNEFNSLSESMNAHPVKLGTIEGDHIIKTISSALKDASHLRNVLPLGVITGSSLATLRTYFQVVSTHDDDQRKVVHKPSYFESSCGRERVGKEGGLLEGTGQHVDSGKTVSERLQAVDSNEGTGQHVDSGKTISERLQAVDSNNGSIMVGAVTAALGASALLAHHQDEKTFSSEGHAKLGEVMQEKNQSTSVSSFAEKAMSVAAPVVPTKSDGEVDQDRLVAVLAELGQKGGMLRLVGKVALLWGGIRGAMSLTDRLISFLHIAERPLFQRVLGFGCMVLVLWSPIVIPLLPTIVQCWTTQSSNRIVEYACIIGVYVAITMLIMIWGKRIRGYENPFEQYGLHLPSTSRVLDFLKGLAGGVMIVLCIHSINALLGYACLSLPSGLPSSSTGAVAFLKTYGSLSLLALRGTITATGIAMVEELLFRSWLTEEVAADYGYYHAILISGLAFSLTQRSLPSIPGFLLLSLALFGMKQRSQGKLYAPIGMRAGIITTNFFLRTGGFLTSWPGTPFWLASTHPWHPFDSAVGISSCAILAIIFYPWLPPQKKEISRAIHD